MLKMQAIKFIFVSSFICISVVESRHNYNDYLRLSLGKDVDSSSEENVKKLKDLKEFNGFKHSIEEHKLEKIENRHDYIKYSARTAIENENDSNESGSSDSSEDYSKFNMHTSINKESEKYFIKDNTQLTSDDSSYSKDDNSSESNENSHESSTEIEWDSRERDDDAFHGNIHNSESKSKFKLNKSKNSNDHHKNNQNKYDDSFETIENISKDKTSESDENYRYVLKNIYNNIKSDHRKTRENKPATIYSSENLSIDDSSANRSSKPSKDITNEASIENSDESVNSQKHLQSSETDSNSIEDDKVRSTEEMDSQEDNNFSRSSEFENRKHFRAISRNYELGSMYRNFKKTSVQRKNINAQNQLNEFQESARSINTKNIHDIEIHKILKESIIKKWREMDIAVKLILIDNYRSIKNSLLHEVNNNPRATNRDISRLERKLLLLFNMTKKDILKTVQLTRKKFRLETRKLNISQQQVYEMEQLYLSKLREQIDAKITAMKRNISFDIEQFHQAVKPIGDYTTQIITQQTSTEIPFDPVFDITTTQTNIITGKPNASTIVFGHVDVGNITPSTLIEVDNSLNSNKTETEVGSHKVTDKRPKEQSSRINARSSKSLKNIKTQTTEYTLHKSSELLEETTNDSYDQNTAYTTVNPTIRDNLSIESLPTTQSATNAKITSSFTSSPKQNNTITNNQLRETLFPVTIRSTHSMSSSLPSVNTANTTPSNIETANTTLDQRSAVTITGSTSNASSTMQTSSYSTEISVVSLTKQNNITTSNQSDSKTSEITTESTSSSAPFSSTHTGLSSAAIRNTEQTNLTIMNESSNQRTTKNDNSNTTSKNTSTNASPKTQTLTTSSVTPSSAKTTKQNNLMVSHQPDKKAPETIIKPTSPSSETSTNSTFTSISSAAIVNTERTHLITTSKESNQSTTETDSSTTSENLSTNAALTQTPTTSDITPSDSNAISDVTLSITNATERNNLTTSNQPDEPATKTIVETTTSPSSETSISVSSTTIVHTEQTHLNTATNSSNQRTSETSTGSTIIKNPSTNVSPVTQTPTTSDVAPVTNTTKQNNLADSNQSDEKVSESTIKIISSVTETSTNLTHTGHPPVTTTTTEQTYSETTNKPTKPSPTLTESTESGTNGLKNISQNDSECFDDSGLVINCETVINPSTTTAANWNLPTDQLSQKWPGIPRECLPLFLAPNGEILSSVSTEHHAIPDSQTLDLCLVIAKTIVQLNHPNSNKSVTS